MASKEEVKKSLLKQNLSGDDWEATRMAVEIIACVSEKTRNGKQFDTAVKECCREAKR